MQQMEETAGWGGTERKRVEAVVETLATLRSGGESLAEVAHDARNMVTALGLYCDLLEEPGVLATPYTHYGNELRLVAAASRRLVEKLVALDTRDLDTRDPGTRPALLGAAAAATGAGAGTAAATGTGEGAGWAAAAPVAEAWSAKRQEPKHRWDMMPAVPIDNLAEELLANRNLLAALAGPAIALTVDTEGGARPVRLTGEDLTRILVNLVKNAAEAMPAGGRIRLGLREQPAGARAVDWLALTMEDSGPGIPAESLEKIFEAGYTTRPRAGTGGWPATHRGLGLAITRSIVEEAGGRIHAANRAQGGARFEMELPVRTR
jgi:signal transduction histidine kinase